MPTILEEAAAHTGGDRQASYGAPAEHFACTAAMVSALLAHKLREPLTAEDWARVMQCD